MGEVASANQKDAVIAALKASEENAQAALTRAQRENEALSRRTGELMEALSTMRQAQPSADAGAARRVRDLEEALARTRGLVASYESQLTEYSKHLVISRDNLRMISSGADIPQTRLVDLTSLLVAKDEEIRNYIAQMKALQYKLDPTGQGSKPRAEAQKSVQVERLIAVRTLLLAKLIGQSNRQTLGKAFAAWLRAVESLKMDRIIADSDKYMVIPVLILLLTRQVRRILD